MADLTNYKILKNKELVLPYKAVNLDVGLRYRYYSEDGTLSDWIFEKLDMSRIESDIQKRLLDIENLQVLLSDLQVL